MMKTIVMFLLLMLIGSAACGIEVQYVWDQPNVTVEGEPIEDGMLAMYDIFLATAQDTVLYARTEAPHVISEPVSAWLSLEPGVSSTIAVRAIDKWDGVGLISKWSDPHTAVPAVPDAPSQPRTRVK
jgi:hypothetical protein